MRNILIVVDMQKDFVTGALASAEAQAILPEVMAKISEYDRAGKEIIFTRDTHGEDYMQTNEGKHLPVPHCIKGTDGWQICAELTDGITSEYKTVDKPTFGFLGMSLRVRLRMVRIWILKWLESARTSVSCQMPLY